ncbi:MAG: hypothetical protein PHH26_06045 [Candidatus Thermoplasmatota archaeon]|nr:hypothetical protein [Candidatus Thermoplasmatota archaeon]
MEYERVDRGLNIDELRNNGAVLIQQGKAVDFRVVEITHREGVSHREELSDYAHKGHRKKEYGLYIR